MYFCTYMYLYVHVHVHVHKPNAIRTLSVIICLILLLSRYSGLQFDILFTVTVMRASVSIAPLIVSYKLLSQIYRCSLCTVYTAKHRTCSFARRLGLNI